MADIIDRQLTRATSPEHHGLYMAVFRFWRTTLVLMVLAFVVAGGIVTAGIVAAVRFTGMPPAAAIGLGALSGVSSVVLGAVWLRKLLKSALARLRSISGSSTTNPPAPDADRAP
ncbi:hypothetical protein DFR70_13032 [Nocardia tenerifensis]|uniref:Uncharacterized protein n=1 Tax=Nocardia tenerifensis TaxID=228006 RepID=A0A318JNA6_9NOCA|nr:hypothetical protein [Nocardia tenerifensis]PXX52784.1 hypothetical protein DFR70_13032 [Nocardia tenerifensis]